MRPVNNGLPVLNRKRLRVRAMFWLLVGVAITMGCFMAAQPAINLQLRELVGSPANAALISTTISTISLFLFAFVIQRKPWPDGSAVLAAPWWVWTGGLLGAAYVALSVVLVSRLGGGVAYSLVVLGQMVFALFMDHFGWIGVPQHEITPGRVAGVLLVVLGVVLIRML
jgi:bacterial/archaeal transporter family-2 protein